MTAMASTRGFTALALAVAFFAVAGAAAAQETPPAEAPPVVANLRIDPLAGAPVVLGAQQLRGLPGEVAAFLLRAEPGGELLMEINAVPVWQGGDKAEVPYQVEIDGASLLDRGQGVHGRVEVYVYALDAQNKLGDYAAQAFSVDIAKLGEAIWQGGLRLSGELALAPGNYRLRVLVRESTSKAAGLRELKLDVPQPTASFSGPPFFEGPQERDGWIPVRAARAAAGAKIVESVPELEASATRAAGRYPLVVENRPLIPTGLPVIVAGRPLTTHVIVRGAAPSALTGELVAADGQRVAVTLGPLEKLPMATTQATVLRFPLTAPDVTAGRWRLELRAGDQALPTRDLIVLPKDTRERELLWTDLRYRAEPPPAVASAGASAGKPAATGRRSEEPPETKETKQEREAAKLKASAIAKDYRALLAAWPGQTGPTQIARLLELEGQILATERLKVVSLLQQAQLSVAKELASWDPEGLVPLIHLHFEAYLAYRQRQSFALLTHSRILVDHLITLYLDSTKNSEGARRLAALAQAGLALEAEEGSLAASSLRLYRKALELDPASRPALLGLASSEHRQNHPSDALHAYEQLVKQHPSLAEGHLRMGVLYGRLGNEKEALAAFERAASLPSPAWVQRLIHQERTRLAIRAKDLRRAAASLPSQPTELGEVALAAYLADQQGELRRSFDLARGVTRAREESARFLFDRVPPDEQRELRQELEKAATQRIPITSEWAAKAK